MIKYLAREKATGKLVEARAQDYLFDGYFYFVGMLVVKMALISMCYVLTFSIILMLLSKRLWGYNDL